MKTFTQQIADAIQASGQTRYRISKATGIQQSVLSKLVHNRVWLAKETMNTLAAYLGLEVTIKPKTAHRKAAPRRS